MKAIFITGSNRGLGKAIAEELLKDEENLVIGIGRDWGIEHNNYRFLYLNLDDVTEVKAFAFSVFNEELSSVSLINNAGILGEIAPLGKLEDRILEQVFDVNLLSVAILMNKFIAAFADYTGKKNIINISSGAAHSPYDGWSAYCASKAGLDMLSRVANEEQKIHAPDNPVRVFSVAPGIIATRMQEQIRSSEEADFSRKQKFVDYFEQGQLATPEGAAEKLVKIFERRDQLQEVVLTIKDLE